MREFQVLRKIYGEFFFLTWLIGGTFQILHITPCSQLPTAIRLKLVLMRCQNSSQMFHLHAM